MAWCAVAVMVAGPGRQEGVQTVEQIPLAARAKLHDGQAGRRMGQEDVDQTIATPGQGVIDALGKVNYGRLMAGLYLEVSRPHGLIVPATAASVTRAGERRALRTGRGGMSCLSIWTASP